jgi:hypothetical protein
MSKSKGRAKKRRPAPRPAAGGKAAPAAPARAPKAASGGGRAPRQPNRRAAEARRRQVRNRALGIGAVAVAIALVGFAVVSARQRHDRVVRKLTAGGCRVDSASDPGAEHVSSPTYRVNPPAGGDHLPSAAPAGFYEPGQQPEDGAAVHSLQHGYIDIWYQPGLDKAALDQVRTLFDAYAKDVLVLPRPSLTQPVAATAWHHRLLCGSVDTAALTTFVTTYRNQGPEKVPHT